MNDDAYFRNLRETLANRAQAYDELVKKENREAEVINYFAPQNWQSLKKWWEESVQKINNGLPAEMLQYVDNGDDVEFRSRTGREWKSTPVEFRHIAGVCTEIAIDGASAFEAQAVDRRLDWISRSRPTTRYTLEDIARDTLTQAVEE